MYALSVKQPWASQIASGRKRAEFRSWMTRHRGPLLICASASPKIGDLPAGVAVCVVDLVDVTGEPGSYAWQIRNPRRVDPIAVRGSAALYKVPDDRIVVVGGVVAAERAPSAERPARRRARAADDDCPPCFVDAATGREIHDPILTATPWD